MTDSPEWWESSDVMLVISMIIIICWPERWGHQHDKEWWWNSQSFISRFCISSTKTLRLSLSVFGLYLCHSFVLKIRFRKIYHFAKLHNAKTTPLICMLSFLRHCTWQEMCLSLSHFFPGSSCTVASPAKWWSTKCTLCSSTFSSPPFPPLP